MINSKQKIAIMQPYFFPYIGYWQLINAVDTFVIYDEGHYIINGWIHRNYLKEKSALKSWFILPISNKSMNLCIRDVRLGAERDTVIKKRIKTIKQMYEKAPFFNEAFPLIEQILLFENDDLVSYLTNEIKSICEFLDIDTKILICSEISKRESLEHDVRDKAFSICEALGIYDYVNPIGGQQFYDKKYFKDVGNVNLNFLKTNSFTYKRFTDRDIDKLEPDEHLSIIDVLMFCGKEKTKELLNEYTLI